MENIIQIFYTSIHNIKKGNRIPVKVNVMLNIKVIIYDGVKYNLENEKIAEIVYNNIRGYEVVTGDRATVIGLTTDENSRDEYNEYLIITLENGETSTFCK